jgi:hypothetical protein
MDETQLVHCLNGKNTFRHIEACDILREGIILDQHGHQVSARQELHDEVEVNRILEGVEQLHDPCRVGFGQYITLGSYVSKLACNQIFLLVVWIDGTDLILLQHLLFLQGLHGVDLACIRLLYQSNLLTIARQYLRLPFLP